MSVCMSIPFDCEKLPFDNYWTSLDYFFTNYSIILYSISPLGQSETKILYLYENTKLIVKHCY